MRVCEQYHPTESAHCGENQCRALRLQAVGLDAPLKNCKQNDQSCGQPVLQNVCDTETFPKAVWAKGPIFWVRAQEEKKSQSQKQQRPHPRPRAILASRKERENTREKDDYARPAVIVLGPCDVCRRRDGRALLARNKRRRKPAALGLGTLNDYAGGLGQLPNIGA